MSYKWRFWRFFLKIIHFIFFSSSLSIFYPKIIHFFFRYFIDLQVVPEFFSDYPLFAAHPTPTGKSSDIL